MPNGSVLIKVLDREYKIACPIDREVDLLRAADLLNNRMLELKRSGNIIGLERIAVITALNLADEIIRQGTTQPPLSEVEPGPSPEVLQAQIDRINDALDQSKRLLSESVK